MYICMYIYVCIYICIYNILCNIYKYADKLSAKIHIRILFAYMDAYITLHSIPLHCITFHYNTNIHAYILAVCNLVHVYIYTYKHSQCNKIPSVMMCGAGVIHRCFGWTGKGISRFSARDDNEGCPLIVIKTT